jgi:hypothetical protein
MLTRTAASMPESLFYRPHRIGPNRPAVAYKLMRRQRLGGVEQVEETVALGQVVMN